jgi:ligand-binding SRPBCC domain-containing protein
MSSYILKRTQKLPIPVAQAWEFFSHPKNLGDITPAYMNFKILSNSFSDTVYAGQIITYKVSPLWGIPMFWMTEITHLKEHEYFIDEQRFGPYSMWQHLHRFEEITGGVLMTDIVNYKMPLGILGNAAHWLFVKKQVEQIFDYRTKVLEEKFGKM